MSGTSRCDNCGLNDSVIQLTQVEGDDTRVLHLCEPCAVERGVDLGSQKGHGPLVDFLAQIGQGVGEGPTGGRCPSCGMTAAQLRQSGRLGCGACYAHFDEHLRGLLRRLHGATKHVGKIVLPQDASRDAVAARINSLRRSLVRAVEAEDFEFAASIRDQLRELETTGSSGAREDGP